MIRLDNVTFSYGEKKIFDGFSLTVESGERIAVMGPSGGGKSTLLNLIAGLLTPQSGTLTVDEWHPVYLFQEPRLFPWLTVEGNVRAVLPKGTSDELVREAIGLVGLADDADAYPDALSGGMKSRASLARALAYGAAVGSSLYLLDEPFAALDDALRQSLLSVVKEKIRSSGATAVLVTHDMPDAEQFGDRIVRIG